MTLSNGDEDSSDCTVRDGYDTCQWGSCVMGCGNFNSSYCRVYYGADSRCQSDGQCEDTYCYDNGNDDRDSGEICSDYKCRDPCLDYSDCACRYGDEYTCASDGQCVKLECYSNDDCATNGEGYVCDTSSDTNWYCFEGCASPNGTWGSGQTCQEYSGDWDNNFYSCNATTGQCDKAMCANGQDDDCDGLTDDNGDAVELVCDWNYCAESCIGQDADFCSSFDTDSICHSDGTCQRVYCNDDGDACPDGTACNGDYCVETCSDDADCSARYSYGQENYVCDAETRACLYRECYADSDCGDGYYCSSESTEWRCNQGCTDDDDCSWGDSAYDCTDGCQADGRCDCTYLGCKADGEECDEWPRLECKDDGDCGVGDDDCADDDDCEGAQVCQYIARWNDGADANEARLCGDSCVGQGNVTSEWGDSRPFFQYYFDYDTCDQDTGTC